MEVAYWTLVERIGGHVFGPYLMHSNKRLVDDVDVK